MPYSQYFTVTSGLELVNKVPLNFETAIKVYIVPVVCADIPSAGDVSYTIETYIPVTILGKLLVVQVRLLCPVDVMNSTHGVKKS